MGGASRVSVRLQQKEAKLNTEKSDDSRSSKLGARDIQFVQTLIERCLQLYMPLKDVVVALQAQAKIEPGFTNLVWQKLEEQNHEFFEAYYLRLKLKDHIIMFNHLVEQQMAMTQKLHTSWMQAMPALMARPPFPPGMPGMVTPYPTPGSNTPTAPTITPDVLQPPTATADASHPPAFTLPLCPLDPATLTGLDDMLLMGGSGAADGDATQPGSSPRAGGVGDDDDGLLGGGGGLVGPTRSGVGGDLSGTDDLIDGLMPGWGRPGPGTEDHLMLDTVHESMGGAIKAFSMSDLKGWGEVENVVKTGVDGMVPDAPGISGVHDSNSPGQLNHDTQGEEAQPSASQGASISFPGGELPGVDGGMDMDGDVGMDGAISELVNEGDVQFHNGTSGQEGAYRPYSLSELPPLDL